MKESSDHWLLRMSLVIVWLVTAAVSLWELNGQSLALMHDAGVHDPVWARRAILAGVAVDIVLGLAIWAKPIRLVFLAALAAMLGMTVIATLLVPTWWLHPFGPLLKNVPIAVVLWILARKPA